MKYLLDTNVIINHLRGKKSIKSEWIFDGCGISIITLGELYYGAYKSQKSDKAISALNFLIKSLSISVINFDSKIINHYAKIKAKLEKQGSKLDDFDLLIGSTAIINNYILVTENKKHFLRIDKLKLL